MKYIYNCWLRFLSYFDLRIIDYEVIDIVVVYYVCNYFTLFKKITLVKPKNLTSGCLELLPFFASGIFYSFNS